MNDPQNNPIVPEDADEVTSLPPVVLGPIEVEDEPVEETAKPLPMPYRRRPSQFLDDTGSRELMLGWCLWLLASWIILGMGVDGTPLRWMILASSFGLMIVWPAYRLSQSGLRQRPGDREAESRDRGTETESTAAASPSPNGFDHPRRTLLTPALIFRDWFALNGVFQAVIWPHLLTGQWTFEQAAWVSGSVATWSLLIGAIVAWGCRTSEPLRRSLAMMLVILLMFAEPVILALANRIAQTTGRTGYDWHMHVSPIEALYALTTLPIDFSPGMWVAPVICVLCSAIVAWMMLLWRGTNGVGNKAGSSVSGT